MAFLIVLLITEPGIILHMTISPYDLMHTGCNSTPFFPPTLFNDESGNRYVDLGVELRVFYF